jgi:hypothetical protein
MNTKEGFKLILIGGKRVERVLGHLERNEFLN